MIRFGFILLLFISITVEAQVTTNNEIELTTEVESDSPFSNPKIIKYFEPWLCGDYFGINTNYTFEEKGEKKDGTPIGKWTITRSDGLVTTLINFNTKGLLNGNIELYNDFGLLIAKGSFINDLEVGQWIIQNNYDNTKAVGNFKNGLPEGEWKIYFKDILFETIEFKNGIPNGKFISNAKYEDGKIFIGEFGKYVNGEKILDKKSKNLNEEDNLTTIDSKVSEGKITFDVVEIDNIKTDETQIDENVFQNINLNEDFGEGKTGNGETYYENRKLKHKWDYNSSFGEESIYYEDGTLMIKRNIKTVESRFEGYNYEIFEYGNSEKYYKNGQLAEKTQYDDINKIETVINYYSDGTISEKKRVDNINQVGERLLYYKDGKQKAKIEDDEVVGDKEYYQIQKERGVFYYPNGKKSAELSYTIGKDSHNDTLVNQKLVTYFENGNIKSITNYQNGLINGECKLYFENGELKINQNLITTDGPKTVCIGKYSSYFENGKISEEGEYYKYNEGEKSSGYEIQGSKKGLWKQYYESGKIKKESLYTDNCNLKSITEYFESGQKKSITFYAMLTNHEETKNGLFKEFFENGKLKTEGTYSFDKKNGKWTTCYSNGKIESEGNYIINHYYSLEGGCRDATYEILSENLIKHYYSQSNKFGEWKFYYENGKLKETGNYKSNKQDEISDLYLYYSNYLNESLLTDTYLESSINYLINLDSDNIEESSNEKTKEPQYIPELKTGIWQYFDESGKLIKTEKN